MPKGGPKSYFGEPFYANIERIVYLALEEVVTEQQDPSAAPTVVAHLTPLAQQLGMRSQFIAQQAADLARRMPDAFDQAVNKIKPALPHAARILADRLQQFVLSTTKKLAARPAA